MHLLTVPEVGQILRVRTSRVYQLIREGRLPATRLGRGLRLFCCDRSREMVAASRVEMRPTSVPTLSLHCRASANELPFADATFHAVVTFNAVHHFDLDRFIAEAARVLRWDGILAIYTRTREQNARTVWGRHFPGFAERETRLPDREGLERAIGNVSLLRLEGILEFAHDQTESVTMLVERTRRRCYSTFTLYSEEEFTQAIATFSKHLGDLSVNGSVTHAAENTMVLARRL